MNSNEQLQKQLASFVYHLSTNDYELTPEQIAQFTALIIYG